jgi:hypothetical protein
MKTEKALRFLLAAALSSLLLTASGGEAKSSSSKKSPPPARSGVTAASVPDACSFIPKTELEALIGWELRDGVSQSMPPGQSQCDFETPPQLYVTRRFNNPPLPQAAGFSSVTITTNATTPEKFAEFRRILDKNAEDVKAVGDGAYFYGPAMIYVRVGQRGFSIRLHVNTPSTDAGRARLREVMLSLARAGVAKL